MSKRITAKELNAINSVKRAMKEDTTKGLQSKNVENLTKALKKSHSIDGKKVSTINNNVEYSTTYSVKSKNWENVENTFNMDNFINKYIDNNNDEIYIFKKTVKTTLHDEKSNKKYTPNKYDNVDDFISNEYINITNMCVHIMAYKTNVKACWDIINKGYENDAIYFDLCQETAFYLVENKKDILENDHVYKLENNAFIGLLRHLNKYLYNNKTRVQNTEIAIVDYDSKEDTFSTIAVNTNAYRQAIANKIRKSAINDTMNKKLQNAIIIVKTYLKKTEKDKLYNILCNYIDLQVMGYSKKDIMAKLDISSATCAKYAEIIKNAYYIMFVKYDGYIEKSQPLETMQPDTLKIDFSNLHNVLHDNAIESFIDKRHNERQAMYNELFRDNTVNNNNDSFKIITPLAQHIACIENYVYNGTYSDEIIKAINELVG